MMHGQVNIR